MEQSKGMDLESEVGFRHIQIAAIKRNPYNPRKDFSGIAFDELVDSVREKGVISPILVRSKKPDGSEFEIVYGERRYRASMVVGNALIPAIVRELDDDEAFDLMTLENLRRSDLTELEQAEGFRAYIERKGSVAGTASAAGAIERLSKRTGILPQYIRKRVALLELPRQVLKAWGEGKLYYGHLEHFMRLKSKQDILGIFREVVKGSWQTKGKPFSVDWLKERIDDRSPDLKVAKFNIKGCAKCSFNSSMQSELYAIEGEAAQCQDRACFKDKQGAWILANWKKSGYRRRYMTSGFRFQIDVSSESKHYMNEVPKACIGCESFVSLLFLDGKTDQGQICIGRAGCYEEKRKGEQFGDKKKKAKGPQAPQTGPRVDWHGTYFRERFFENAIPARMDKQKPASLDIRRLTLFSLIKSNSDLDTWFAGQIGLDDSKDGDDHRHYFGLDTATVFDAIVEMDIKRIDSLFREASARVIMQGADTATRRRIAAYLGIKLDEEWSITAEYLDKKTKQEILDLGVTLHIFDDEKAEGYLKATLKKKAGKYTGLKKPELVDLFLKSGVDLVGKVPEEILSAAERWKGSL